ncbi:MAG: pantetheine-phosphate adenylyltransferase [Campylobacterota bacterium]|nr:pantetheine-phosphate adenylyltransferase [Campylobacterota bacterium]
MSIKKAIYSGTFDPFTNGHMDILIRGLKIYDEIIIAVANSSSKKPMFNINSRVNIIQNAIVDLDNVTVEPFSNLLVEFAKSKDVYHVIRGLRTTTDFEYELQMSYANSTLDKNIDTVFLMPTLKNAFISSSIVRELIRFKSDYSHLVPKHIVNEIKKEVKQQCI